MATVACPHCANPLSPAAKSCPKCRSPANAREAGKRFVNCRACGTTLARAAVKTVGHETYMLNGTTHFRRTVQHHACPSCGEPKPSSEWHDSNANQTIIGLLGGGAILFLLFVLMVYRANH